MPEGKIVLLTGGTGSFGQGFLRMALQDQEIRMVRIFSRDEHKQRLLRQEVGASDRVSFYIGDIRDKDRLARAMNGADWVIHAAALKQAPLGEIEPQEFIKTNVIGSMNVVEAALDCGLEKALLVSTDKAVEPINLYGATKMCAERTFLQADAQRGTAKTRFALTRYGNVAGTSGSVIPLFQSLPYDAPTPITHLNATRFWITLEHANAYVMNAIKSMRGGEVLIPKLKSVRVVDIAKAVRPDSEIKVIGLRPGDKLHEVLSVDGTRYASNDNEFLTIEDIKDYIHGCPSASPL